MKTKNIFLIFAMGTMIPVSASAQDVIEKDSVINTKEEKNRNVMLNAQAIDKPRQINVGLPETKSATVFEDGIPVSYYFFPDMPYYSWYGGVTYDRTSVMSLSEGAIQYGQVNYIVNSRNRYSTDKTGGIAQYQVNHYGRQSLDMAMTGKIGGGWGYTVNTHQIWDPGTYKLIAAPLQTRIQSYKLGIDKTFAQGRGKASLLYQYARYYDNSSNNAPFIFVGDGSVKKYKGIKMGNDGYLAREMSTFPYMDVIDGSINTIDWKKAATTYSHTVRFNLDYTFKNGNVFSLSSKLKFAHDNNAGIHMSGVSENTGQYYYADGKAYTGDMIQNFNMSYQPDKDNEWLSAATLTGKSKNGRHSWRLGANYWYAKSYTHEMLTNMVQTVEKDPYQLYIKNANGVLTSGISYNGQSGYYDGHENNLAVYVSDDWNISKKLFMSLGLRLAYVGYSAKTANNLNGDESNTRRPGWYLEDGKHKVTRITGDFLNPAVAYNVHYSIAKGFGLVGEYVYTKERPYLEDYASETAPTGAQNTNMARGGIFWNNSWIQLVSQISYIYKTNNKRRNTFYHIMQKDAIDDSGLKKGDEDNRGIQTSYGIQTLGWITDVILTPFRGFTFHGSFTLQNPKYKDLGIFATFSDGMTDGMDVSGNTVTSMSKILIELDPSYHIGKFRFNLNFRYFSKQYINKTNTLYFNGWWESFGSVQYHMNRNIDFAVNVTNLFNQLGAKGNIGAADLVTDVSQYKNYVMTGSYIRPFEISASATIRF